MKQTTIVLIVLLAIRGFGQFYSATSAEASSVIMFLIFGAIYTIALIGVFLKQKWGLGLAAAIAVIDISLAVVAVATKGEFSWGSVIIDATILLFGIKEYRSHS